MELTASVCVCSCVEILIKEQTRRYIQKMEEIQQLENAEAMAIKQLKLRRQNTVRQSVLEMNCAGITWETLTKQIMDADWSISVSAI